jgi:hypothetical protein
LQKESAGHFCMPLDDSAQGVFSQPSSTCHSITTALPLLGGAGGAEAGEGGGSSTTC